MGTRIIIVDPVDPLVEDIRTGVFLAAIEETWFRLVEKKQAHICLRADGAEMQAKVPFPFPIPLEDTDDVKVWLKEGDHITAGDPPYRIKRLHVGWRSDGRVREELQGMAVIHNRMKVCSIPMMWGEPGIRDAVFGYVEFDRELDRELRKTGNQRPNHYDLDWRRTIPGAIKHYVEAELLHYGQEKLGLGVDPRKRQQRARSEAEQWALRQLAVLTPDFDLMAAHHGTRRPPTRPGQPSDKTVGLTFHVVRFPNPRRAPLVRWNERLAGFTVEAFNEQETTYSCRGQVHVFRANRQILRLVDQRAVVLRPHASVPFGPLEIHFTRQLFPEPERYTLRATLINEVNGQRLDELNRYLWVEKEPPFRAPFDVQPAELPPPYDSYQWRMVPTGDDYFTLYYNTAHPAYLHSEGMGACRLYCFEIFLEGALELVLDRPVGDNGVRDYHPLDRAKVEASPKDSYSEIIRMLSKVRHRLYEGLR